MAVRKNRIAVALGTMVGGTIAVTWKDPDTVDGSNPVTIQLEYAPTLFWVQRNGSYGGTGGVKANAGELTVDTSSVTANGCTVTSSNAADTGGVRVYAVCRQGDL